MMNPDSYLTPDEIAALIAAGLPVPGDDEINTFMRKFARALVGKITDWREVPEDTDNEDV